MKVNNGKRLMSTVFITGLAFVVNYMITLVLTPFITDNVGTEAYGFVTLAKNIAQYATYVTMALNSFAARYISVEYHKGKMKNANMYFSSTFYGDTFVGVLIFILSLVGIANLERIFHVPGRILTDVKVLFVLVFLKFLVNTVLSVYEAGTLIANRLDLVGVFKLFSFLIEAVILFIFFKIFPAKVSYVGVGLLAAAAFLAVSEVWICRKYTPQLQIQKALFRINAVKELVGNGIWSSINSLGSFLHNGLDLMICNLMLTPLAMGQLAISENVSMIFKSVLVIIAQPFQPLMLKKYADGDIDGLMRQMNLAMKMSSMVSNICFAGFTALGISYYRLWIPNQDIALIYKITLIASLSCITHGILYPTYYVYTLTLRKKWPCIFTLAGGFLNVAGMYILIRFTHMGIYAVVWTTAVLITVTNLVCHALYVPHVLHLPKWTLFPTIIRCIASCGILTAFFCMVGIPCMPHTWLGLISMAFILAAIGAVLHGHMTLTEEEKTVVLNTLKRKKA